MDQLDQFFLCAITCLFGMGWAGKHLGCSAVLEEDLYITEDRYQSAFFGLVL